MLEWSVVMKINMVFHMTSVANVHVMLGKDVGHCIQLGGDSFLPFQG